MRSVFAGILLITLAVAPSVLAHDGHDHKTMGTVSAVKENRLEVAGTDDKTHIFVMGEKTRVLRGRRVVQAADIKTRERVVVVFTQARDAAGKMTTTVKQVHLAAAGNEK